VQSWAAASGELLNLCSGLNDATTVPGAAFVKSEVDALAGPPRLVVVVTQPPSEQPGKADVGEAVVAEVVNGERERDCRGAHPLVRLVCDDIIEGLTEGHDMRYAHSFPGSAQHQATAWLLVLAQEAATSLAQLLRTCVQDSVTARLVGPAGLEPATERI